MYMPLRLSILIATTLVFISGLIFCPVQAAGEKRARTLLHETHKASQIIEGHGSKTLYIIFDPNCPYCHKLFEELHPYVVKNEVTIHWIPVGILTNTSPGKAAAILQAKNRLKAFYQSEHHWNNSEDQGGRIAPLQNPSAKTRHELEANDNLLTNNNLNGVPVTLFVTTNNSAFYFEGTPPAQKMAKILQYVK